MVPCSRVNECPPEHVQKGIHSPSSKSQKGIHSPSNMGVFLGCCVSGWILWAVCSICWVCVWVACIFVWVEVVCWVRFDHISVCHSPKCGGYTGGCGGTGACRLITHTGDDRSYAYRTHIPPVLPRVHPPHHPPMPHPVIHPTHHPTALHVWPCATMCGNWRSYPAMCNHGVAWVAIVGHVRP
jgi:hypothetical protein